MTRIRSIAVALTLAMGAIPVVAVLAPSAVQAAEQAKANKITTRAIAEPLKKAQAAIQSKQWDTALAEIRKAQAVEKKTPFEAHQIDALIGYVLVQQKKSGEAALVYERLLNSGFLSAEQVDESTRTVANLYFHAKEYRKAAEWARKWLAKYPDQEEMAVLLGKSQYLLKDWKNAAATMMGVVRTAERGGQTPTESWLQIVLSSYFEIDDKNGTGEALKTAVRYYPKGEYWGDLLEIYRHKETSDRISRETRDRITLGYYRLMNDVGMLKDKRDYVEMAQLAIDTGVPGEAQQVVAKGVENGTLKSSDKTEQGRYDRLRGSAEKLVKMDRAALAQLAKEAEKAPKGQADVALGQAYLSYGRYDEAIQVLQRGLSKGGVTDVHEAQISLGIAYLKKGQKDQARQAFQTARGDSRWGDLAELWTIHTHQAA